jgi:hypothetical protein
MSSLAEIKGRNVSGGASGRLLQMTGKNGNQWTGNGRDHFDQNAARNVSCYAITLMFDGTLRRLPTRSSAHERATSLTKKSETARRPQQASSYRSGCVPVVPIIIGSPNNHRRCHAEGWKFVGRLTNTNFLLWLFQPHSLHCETTLEQMQCPGP